MLLLPQLVGLELQRPLRTVLQLQRLLLVVIPSRRWEVSAFVLRVRKESEASMNEIASSHESQQSGASLAARVHSEAKCHCTDFTRTHTTQWDAHRSPQVRTLDRFTSAAQASEREKGKNGC